MSSKTNRASKIQRDDREFHIIDIENELGTGHFTSADVAAFRIFYVSFANVAPDAHIVIAASSEQGAYEAHTGWPGARLVFRRGHNGADLALIDVVSTENISDRFSRVVVGSGDGIFAPVVADLLADGVQVEVVSRSLAVSGQFTHASSIVRLFGPRQFSLAA